MFEAGVVMLGIVILMFLFCVIAVGVSKDSDTAAIAFIAALSILFSGVAVGMTAVGWWRQEMIERGHAQYHPTTGEWMWTEHLEESEDD